MNQSKFVFSQDIEFILLCYTGGWQNVIRLGTTHRCQEPTKGVIIVF